MRSGRIEPMMRACLAAAALMHAPATAAAEPPHKVMMVLWRGCEDACKGFQEYLRSKELAVEFLERDVKQDASLLPGLVNEARALDVDLVVTWGTTATLGITGEYDKADPARYLTDIPVLFMIVTDPLEARVVENIERPGRNISGTLYLVPEDVQMRAIRSYMPFDKLGMIYNTNELNAVISADKVRATAAAQGFQVVAREVPNDAGGKPIADSLPRLVGELADESVDLIYIGSSSFIVLNRDLFTEAAVQRGIPVAAAGEVAVLESDALMGLVSRYHTVGQLTAARAEEILLGGKKPGDIAIESLSRYSFLVNMEIARRLHRYPPMTLLNIAEVIKVPEGPR
jgi:putative tryptophan/tyrosine transport system substrate-binding protein